MLEVTLLKLWPPSQNAVFDRKDEVELNRQALHIALYLAERSGICMAENILNSTVVVPDQKEAAKRAHYHI